MEKTATIQGISRRNNSYYGNPAHELAFTDGTSARTMANAGISYAIGNPGLRVGDLVKVTYTRAGRISNLEPASSPSADWSRELVSRSLTVGAEVSQAAAVSLERLAEILEESTGVDGSELVEAAEDHLWPLWVHVLAGDVEEAARVVLDHFAGVYASPVEFAQEIVSQFGLDDDPATLAERMERAGEVFSHPAGAGRRAYFWSH